MSDFDTAADVELGSRVSAEAQWEQAKLDIPRHDAEFEAAQVAEWGCTCEYPYPPEIWMGHHPNCEER